MNKSKKVAVYRNLHKSGYVYSVQDCRTKRVIDRSSLIFLKDCEFKVSEAGRQRVLREKRKNVHAKIVGIRIAKEEWDETFGKLESMGLSYYLDKAKVAYNPYKNPTFTREDGSSVFEARYVAVNGGSIYAFGLQKHDCVPWRGRGGNIGSCVYCGAKAE